MAAKFDFTVDDVFQVPYLEEFFNGIAPEQADDTLLRDKFFPLQYVQESNIVTLHSQGYTGRTPAVSAAADVPKFSLPSLFVKDYEFGYWGEGAVIDKATIQRAEQSKTEALTMQGIVNQFLQGMAYRNNKLFEWTSAQTLFTGGFSINANGVTYTYSDGVPAFYRLDMTDTSPFTAAYWTPVLWSDATNCKPLLDIVRMSKYAGTLGLKIEEMIMSSAVAALIENSAEVMAWLKANQQMALTAVTAKYAIEQIAKLKDVSVTIDDRVHTERAIVMANAANDATVIQVDDISNFSANDYVLVKQGKDQARCKVNSTSTSGLNKFVTLAATPGFALVKGQAVIDIGVPYCPANMVAFRTSKQRAAGWMILPDNIRNGDPMEAKIHLWSKPLDKEPNYERHIGNYFKGGIINREPGNYLTLKVKA